MKNFAIEVINFLKRNKVFTITILIAIILSYGYIVVNQSVHVDDTSFNRYYEEEYFLAQGRFIPVLLHKITGAFQYAPFWLNALSSIVLFFATTIWSMLLKKASKDKLSITAINIFGLIFVTYPLINEIFIYMGAALLISLGYLLTAISIMLFNKYREENKYKYLFLNIILNCCILAIYESFAVVYICGVLMTLILEYLNSDTKLTFIKLLKDIFFVFISLVVPLIIKTIIVSLIIKPFCNPDIPNYAANKITWRTIPFIDNFKKLVLDLINKYMLSGVRYLPILMYALALGFSFIISIGMSIKKKNINIFILFVGLVISTILLSLVQGSVSPYRTCQVFAIFVAFIFMILFSIVEKDTLLKNIMLFIVIIIVLNQSRDLSQWFYLNGARYDYEKTVASNIGTELEKVNIDNKPIVFIGSAKCPKWILEFEATKMPIAEKVVTKVIRVFPKAIEDEYAKVLNQYRPNQNNSGSLFSSWATVAFGEVNTEYFKFLSMHGYTFNQGSKEQLGLAWSLQKDMEGYPRDGYIYDAGEFYIINMGSI